MNALRALIDPSIDRESDLFKTQSELFSLNDIFKRKDPNNDGQFVESYIMLHEEIEQEHEFNSETKDITLVVKRQKLIFNEKN
mgnify:CR=1 FL=1